MPQSGQSARHRAYNSCMRIHHTSAPPPQDPAENALPRERRRKPGNTAAPVVAHIDEAACIGCTLCIEACPVDAIVGAATLMHTVIVAECIGCRLCLPPCPVDCIAMAENGAPPTREQRRLRATRARMRYTNRVARRERERSERSAPRASATGRRKRETVARAMRRARERLRRNS